MTTAASPRHALLISGDPKFLEGTEHSLQAGWPTCLIRRIHPGGDPAVLRFSLAEPGTLAVIDRRFPLKLELNRMIGKLPATGGKVVAVSAVPRKLKDMQEVVFDDGFGLLSHNLDWDSPKIGAAIVAAHQSESLAEILPESSVAHSGSSGKSMASGHVLIKDSKHKSLVVEQLAAQLGQAAGMQRTRRSKIASVVDELLMNALYHAAKDEESQSFAHLDWQVDETGVFRSTVTDMFGTYTREDAHRKLVSFLANEMVEITQTAGRGGGVGLYLVFKVSAEYRLYVNPGRKTEISIRVDPLVKSGQGPATNVSGLRAKREVLIYFAPFRPKS